MLKKSHAAFKAFPHINSVKKRTVLPASSGGWTENQRDLVTPLKSHRKAAAEQRMKSALATSRAAELSPQQARGMWSSILLAICALSSDITVVIHYAMCNETLFFFSSFFYVYLSLPSSMHNPHHCYWLTLVTGGSDSPWQSDNCHVLWRVIPLLSVCPSRAGQQHRETAPSQSSEWCLNANRKKTQSQHMGSPLSVLELAQVVQSSDKFLSALWS